MHTAYLLTKGAVQRGSFVWGGADQGARSGVVQEGERCP